jgi:hypothetical protein
VEGIKIAMTFLKRAKEDKNHNSFKYIELHTQTKWGNKIMQEKLKGKKLKSHTMAT